MRFEQESGPGKGNWYEIDVLPAPGDKQEYYVLVGWGPPDMVLEDKREIFKGSWDSVIDQIDIIRKRIERAGYNKIEEKEKQEVH